MATINWTHDHFISFFYHWPIHHGLFFFWIGMLYYILTIKLMHFILTLRFLLSVTLLFALIIYCNCLSSEFVISVFNKVPKNHIGKWYWLLSCWLIEPCSAALAYICLWFSCQDKAFWFSLWSYYVLVFVACGW